MIRLLDGLVVLKEIDEVDGISYTSAYFKKKYNRNIVYIRRVAYIYAHVLPEEILSKVTILDDYIPLGELVEHISIQKSLIMDRIKFMSNTGAKLFCHKLIGGVWFINVDDEFKHLLQNYQPFLLTLKDTEFEHLKMLGDMKIGFY